jgi:hypothetical protein
MSTEFLNLDAIEGRAEAATEGPWKQTHDIKRGVKLWGRDDAGGPLFYVFSGVERARVSEEDPDPQWLKDTRFVRSAR